MTTPSGTFTSPVDQSDLATYAWGTDNANPRGIVQIAHGLGEHSSRYARLADALTAAGYVVGAIDHRGHGASIADGGVPGDFGAAGWDGLVADLVAFGASLREQHPGLPMFLIAHSMGSMAAQSAILDHGDGYAGVVLSGSTAIDVLAANMASSPEPAGLEAFNEGFEHRTGYEWLSRDEAEVDAYVADPLCGFPVPDSTMPQLFSHAGRVGDPEALRSIRPDLPILIISGDADPLAGGGQLIELLGQRYRDAGVRDVTVRLYPQARHEVFNETNRDEVVGDVLDWLGAHTSA
ncbi:MAG TPA: alpha/beta hydrolase [Intrasporangiaceae bacterium]|nr:alpha/beta hydrolase [Intrasporangiaceae bacterium]